MKYWISAVWNYDGQLNFNLNHTIMKRIAISFMFLTLMMVGSVYGQNVNEPAPDFTLNTLSGESFKLSDHSGKVIFIFVFGYACGFCENAGPFIQNDLVDPYMDTDNYYPIGIDTWDGSPAAVRSFQNKTGVIMPLLLSGSSFANLYDTPYDRLIVIDADGIMVHKGMDNANSDRVDAKKSIDEALAKIAPTAIDIQQTDAAFQVSLFPNPAKEDVRIKFDIPSSGLVSVKIVSIDGRVVQIPLSEDFAQGSHTQNFNVGNLERGMYYLQMTYNNQILSTKFIAE